MFNTSYKYSDIDINVILHLNKILLTNWKELWEAKFRSSGDIISDSYDSWVYIHDKKIDLSLIQSELSELINWYKTNNIKVNSIIRIAVFIYRLIRISPFLYLNKLTVIAVADYLLYKNGYVHKTYIPISRNFDIYEDDYIECWNHALQGKLDPKTQTVIEMEDITIWLERVIRNISNDFVEVREAQYSKISDTEKGVRQPFLDLNKRQLKILRYLQTIPTLKREDYVQIMDVSTMTAFRDLSELVKKKLLKIEGRGRGTKYMLANR